MDLGVYVAPEHRGKAVGRELLAATIREAEAIPGLTCILLNVATTQQSARRLYLSLGFRSFGVEPQAIRIGDRDIDEEHMFLELSPPHDRLANSQ